MGNIWTPHVTVAAIVCSQGRYLMVEEQETPQSPQVYNQPAGHLDPNESLITAAMRETLEETGWRLQVNFLVGIYHWLNPHNGITYVRFVFAGDVHDHDPTRVLDTGIITTHWLSSDELRKNPQQLRNPLVLACIDDYERGQQLPLDVIKHIRSACV